MLSGFLRSLYKDYAMNTHANIKIFSRPSLRLMSTLTINKNGLPPICSGIHAVVVKL